MYIVIAIIMFGVLIAIHEFGHFATAKACGVRVDEFSIGMGPAIIKKQRGETLYSLRILPIGGVCAMGEDEESQDPRAFPHQSFWKRVLSLCAGSFMNFLLGVILIVIMYGGAEAFRAPIITDFLDGCQYNTPETFQAGDEFYSIDGNRIYLISDVSMFLERVNGVYDIVMLCYVQLVEFKDMKRVPTIESAQGLKYGFVWGIEKATFGVKLEYVWNTAKEFSRLVWLGLGDLIHGAVGVDDMAGPVGIVDMMNDAGSSAASTADAMYSMLYFSAFIAINLAIMNMLPIPALDGGRVFLMIVTVIIEAITKKKLDPKYEGYIHAGGMVLLLLLMGFIMYNDIARLITG